MKACKVCAFVSLALGKKIIMPLISRDRINIYHEDVEQHLYDLDLSVVGGLSTRGWTQNDIDVVGAVADVPVLAARLQATGITHPVHYCGTHSSHSHIACAYYGIKLVFTGKGY